MPSESFRSAPHPSAAPLRFGRRVLLQASAATFASQALLDRAALSAEVLPVGAGAPASRKRARSLVFLFMWGGPSQLDSLDPKMNAPAEIRGEFKAIPTSVPDIFISEHFQMLAKRMEHVAILRSLSHSDPAHLSSAHATLTGHKAPVWPSDNDPPSERDTPHIGSALAFMQRSGEWRRPPVGDNLPAFVSVPWHVSHPAAPGGLAGGQHAGWLGHGWDPFLIQGDPSQPQWDVPALRLLDGNSGDRLRSRSALLATLDQQRAALLDSAQASTLSGQQVRAVELLTSPGVRNAFDLKQEPDAVRDRYGRHIHGQCVLLARRLVEHGVPVVTVNWHNDGQNFWDTHGNNFNRLKTDLIPPADRALSALLDDLSERGLLDETLIAWVGEFGRRPTITAGNAGREHWPNCYSGILAGGGVQGGLVFGSSDQHAAWPASNPVSPADFAATILHGLGISEETLLYDRIQRPQRLFGGKPVTTLFG